MAHAHGVNVLSLVSPFCVDAPALPQVWDYHETICLSLSLSLWAVDDFLLHTLKSEGSYLTIILTFRAAACQVTSGQVVLA